MENKSLGWARNWRKFVSVLIAALGGTALSSQVADKSPLLLQHPTLSESRIVFVYGGDLWSVSREGGTAERLTAGVGLKSRPFFSPDGSEIAFTASYDGNSDVYVNPGERRSAQAADPPPCRR